jgi:hypothetical protein
MGKDGEENMTTSRMRKKWKRGKKRKRRSSARSFSKAKRERTQEHKELSSIFTSIHDISKGDSNTLKLSSQTCKLAYPETVQGQAINVLKNEIPKFRATPFERTTGKKV